MKYKQPYSPRRSAIALAITASFGGLSVPTTAFSDVYTWGVMTDDSALTTTCAASPDALPVLFTMLTSGGSALANSSISTKGANQYQTNTCGTLSYDTATQSGTMSIGAFDFYDGTEPAVAAGITINRVPDGLDDGSGNLLLANMLFNWNGSNGIPVSLTMDAGPLLDEMAGSPTTFTLTDEGGGVIAVATTGASPLDASESSTVPASDGTYTNATWGYLTTGPVPLATTEWNTTNVAGCVPGNCMGVSPSADINASSTVEDLAANSAEYTMGDGVGVGGNPMQDGPFQGFNANFDFTSMTLTSFTDTTAPIVTLDGNNTIDLIVGDPAYDGGTATCRDAAPLNAYTYTPALDAASASLVPISTATTSTTVLTYECFDGSGNKGTVTRTVNVKAPDAVITLNADVNNDVSPVTQECAVPYVDAGATCLDPEDGPILGANDPLSGNALFLDQSNVDDNISLVGGPYIATWSCTDSAANTSTQDRSVNIVDTTKPVVTLIGSSPENVASSTPQNVAVFVDQMAEVVDSCDTSLSSPFTATSGSVTTMVVPDTGPDTIPYSLTYTVTDAEGNIGTAPRTVNVVRSQPVIKLNGSQTVVIANVGDTYTEDGMDIHDAQDGNELGVVANGTAVSGLTYSISGTVDTNTNGTYILTYSATDSDGNIATSVTREVKVGVFAVGSNFTMLNPSGNVIGGTNDVVFSWDETENTAETDLNFNMTIASALPHPFFGAYWYAHHVRVFGPGTYSFETDNTLCQSKAASPDAANTGTKTIHATAADIDVTGCPGTGTPTTMAMTVGAGQLGVHMLFDYNGTFDIDVVNVWDKDAVWNDPTGQGDDLNDLWSGAAGDPPDPEATWKLVSRDVNGDTFNGTPMVDGPFKGFSANFNAGPSGTVPPPEPITTTVQDTVIGSGAISWLALLGMLPVIGLFRRNKKS